MARPKRVVPKPCLHKPSGRARVYINGEYVYLGKWGSPEADEEYRRLIIEMETVPVGIKNATVNDLVARFLVWAEKHYRDQNGEPTGTFNTYKYAIQELILLDGKTRVAKFGPIALKTVREKMVECGYCRTKINDRVSQIRTMFKWGVENELVPETVYRALLCVRGLEEGKTTAPDYPPIVSVSSADVIKTLEFCHKTLADMIRVQKLAGMRPQEVRLMRSCDLLKNDQDIWVYVPHRHKTQHKKKHRTIFILPECQEILMPYLIDKEDQPEAYLFSPADAMKMIAIEKREKRKSKVQPSQQVRKKGTSRYNDHYTRYAYSTAIERACDRACVPRWSPNRLRHSRATELYSELSRELGHDAAIEAVRIMLGHSDITVTKIYLDSEALLKESIALTIENAKRLHRVGD